MKISYITLYITLHMGFEWRYLASVKEEEVSYLNMMGLAGVQNSKVEYLTAVKILVHSII